MNWPSIEAIPSRLFHNVEVLPLLLCSSINLLTKSVHVKYLLSRPSMSGHVARWILQLNEFDITIITLR